MTTPTQTLTDYQELLGLPRAHPTVTKLLEQYPDFHFRFFFDKPTKVNWEIVQSQKAHSLLQFKEGMLDRISIFPTAGNADLIPGINLLTVSQEEILEHFGKPSRTGRNSVQFQVGNQQLTFAFLSQQLRAVTVNQP